ncbi:helix-turn-helix domain-containing protein [Streptomyces sp. MS2.AVA.5]|uniref:Helix-turn-helix domain-containing protein n=1 Tax=Streptomyces achmelvichensis TaxID=3134111 RepID=A0ACC6Q935_9ACTN
MPTLGYLIDERPELQLRFGQGQGATDTYATTKVTVVIVLDEDSLRSNTGEFAHPPGALILLPLEGAQHRATAPTIERLLHAVARRRLAGLVVTADQHESTVFQRSTRQVAQRLRIPLLTTTAETAAWANLNEGIQRCRVQDAERQVESLGRLMQQLPARLADATAMHRIAAWLEEAVGAEVLVSGSDGEVEVAVPSSARRLGQALPGRRDTSGAGAVLPDQAGSHTRVLALSPTGVSDAFLVVAGGRPFDEADTRLIKQAARMLDLVEQAQRDSAHLARTAREARAFTYQLLMGPEPDRARRFLHGLGIRAHADVRVFVIDCGSAEQREIAMVRCEKMARGRALLVCCPENRERVVVVEPVDVTDQAGSSIVSGLRELVLSRGGALRLGGSNPRPLSLALAALQEAVTSLKFCDRRREPYVLAPAQSNLVDYLDLGPAREWGRRMVAPIRTALPGEKAAQIEETLPVAFSRPHTQAAHDLNVHRNTVAARVARASELLQLDLSRTYNKVIVGLAIDLAALPDHSVDTPAQSKSVVDLEELLSTDRVRAWGEALIDPVRADRRDLLRTLAAWLDHDESVEKAAGALEIADATVRNHLKTIEQLSGSYLTSRIGLRDITIALSVCTGTALPTSDRIAAA